MRLLAAALLLVAPLGAAFYLPGLAPVSFCEEGEETESCKVRASTGGPDAGRPLAPLRSGLPRRGGSAEYSQSRRSRVLFREDTPSWYSLFPLNFAAGAERTLSLLFLVWPGPVSSQGVAALAG